MKRCSYCGHENENAAVTCAGCGEAIQPVREADPELRDPALSPVVVGTFSSLQEATVLAGRLQAAGIEATVPEEYSEQVFSSVIPLENVTVRVAAKDYEAARAIAKSSAEPPAVQPAVSQTERPPARDGHTPLELIHHIYIVAPAERIYDAITTAQGIRSWWTADVSMDRHVGGKALFGFENHTIFFEMRIEQLESPWLVRWKCEGGASEEWIGTTQEFKLEAQEDGQVLLKFRHAAWKPGSDYAYLCNTTWGHLLVLLKEYAERGEKKPFFK